MASVEQLHPFHPHKLQLCDSGSVYGNLTTKWSCDVCGESYDGRSDEETSQKTYHCYQCKYFDMCMNCYRGYLHPFHTHRLQPADPQLCYPHTKGLWRCDACQNIHAGMSVSPRDGSNHTKMYHCSRCQVDLCMVCYKGDNHHVLHEDSSHPLVPINPGIYYRLFNEWMCTVCGNLGNHKKALKHHFHCNECDEDICIDCYYGTKHFLHAHNLVKCTNTLLHSSITSSCNECRKGLYNNYYLCKRPECSYYLCQDCYNIQPKPHPLHPKYDHILHVTDHMQVYPESEGMWYCDNCSREYSSRTKLYHCNKCGYDLCTSCYIQYGSIKTLPNMSPPTPCLPGPPTSPQKNITSKDQYDCPISYISDTKPGLCNKCGLKTAKLTPVHMGVAHTTPIYCKDCSEIVLYSREMCSLCGRVPDNMVVL